MSIRDLFDHVISTPSVMQLVLCTWISFVAVYRWGITRWIKYNFVPYKKYKVLECETCFSFWFCCLISTNLITGMIAYLIFNFYEKNRIN